ncbi:WD40/YVTN/BNR-like repeat-containing protein [Streptomyces sp. NBC_01465]|uniref:WD40/YVTN/BNR-like repeat-containing protein n=1 Tax=Streptomyces sp. NBC_01465 TaxID=2903878 RepID=UPI002E2FD0F2|nr:hypothetical protein [Streptomyces sp. NBC_01465]
MISPPAGPAHLFSGVGDVGGFRHTDLNKATQMYDNPTFVTTPALDYAELAPHTIVRVGNPAGGWTQHFGISTDGGDTWTPSRSEPSGVTGPGVDDQAVAISADGRRIVWSPAGAPAGWSDDHGATWTASEGLPAGVSVRSDRVNPAKFYAYGSGVFYLSTDGGKSFKATAASGLPTAGNVRFKAVPGQEGGIFRSDDAGRTGIRINDDRHQYAWTGNTISGDPRIYGRVYFGPNGRGVMYGDPK